MQLFAHMFSPCNIYTNIYVFIMMHVLCIHEVIILLLVTINQIDLPQSYTISPKIAYRTSYRIYSLRPAVCGMIWLKVNRSNLTSSFRSKEAVQISFGFFLLFQTRCSISEGKEKRESLKL